MSQQDTEELPQRIKEDFVDHFRTELHKHYLENPSGIRLYRENEMVGFYKEFENKLEDNLVWVQPLIVDYLDVNGIRSSHYRTFRTMAIELIMELVQEKI